MGRARDSNLSCMLTTFCLRLACGMIGSLLLLSRAEVNPRFYRTHYLIAGGLLAVAAMSAGSEINAGLWWTLGAAALLAFLGSITWSVQGNPRDPSIRLATALSLRTPPGFPSPGTSQTPP